MSRVNAYEACKPVQDTDALVRRHAELVKRIAYHLAGRLPSSVDVADLIQAGMLGLLEAAGNYTADRGASFETYAGIRIRGAMLDALRKLDWAPRSVHRKARAVAAAVRELEAETGREAQDSDIAARMGVSIDEYFRVVQDATSCHLVSLNETVGEDDSPLVKAVDDKADPFREIADADFRKALVLAIDELPEREKLVMSLYYDEELNLKEIGAVLKVTESRVCQLHGQALVRLKARLADWRDRRDLAEAEESRNKTERAPARRTQRPVLTRA
jgi:RNA polymerase sigma factor FliA